MKRHTGNKVVSRWSMIITALLLILLVTPIIYFQGCKASSTDEATTAKETTTQPLPANHPAQVEKLAREKLGLARSSEIVTRFERDGFNTYSKDARPYPLSTGSKTPGPSDSPKPNIKREGEGKSDGNSPGLPQLNQQQLKNWANLPAKQRAQLLEAQRQMYLNLPLEFNIRVQHLDGSPTFRPSPGRSNSSSSRSTPLN